MKTLQDYIDKLNSLNFKEMYNNDFFWTWDKTDEELEAVLVVLEPVSIVSVLEFSPLSLVESEPQADNSPTVRAEARITEINFFFINPPE